MKTKLLFLLALLQCALLPAALAYKSLTVQIKTLPQANGQALQKVWLQSEELPIIKISEAKYRALPHFKPDSGFVTGEAAHFTVHQGVDRKQPFAYVAIPIYRQTADGWEALQTCTLELYESPATAKAQKPAAVTNSPLAEGAWYKIAIPGRGIYKIDYDFIAAKTGHSGALNSGAIRLFGHGGTMLPESNALPRPDGLVENRIAMYDGGDGTFGPGDYFVFYANGPTLWEKDSLNQAFKSSKNLYEDKSYYFLNLDGSGGLRVQNAGTAGPATTTVTDFNAYALHEKDEVNINGYGKAWWGDAMGSGPGLNNTREFSFSFPDITGPVRAEARVGVRSITGSNTLNLTCNGQGWGAFTFAATPAPEVNSLLAQTVSGSFSGSGNTVQVTATFNSPASDAKAYLDYLVINTRAQLSFQNGFLDFRDWQSVGAGSVANFELKNANGNVEIWEVTDPVQPVRRNTTLSGSTLSFTNDAQRLREYIAFEAGSAAVPEYIGPVANQNLHGHGQVDLIIVTAPEFADAAQDLAQFHRDYNGSRVVCATTTQIYNEFSSGSQDISAIRDFARMFYKRAGADTAEMPRNLLLFGDASYDYKDRVAANTNFVPTFQSRESVVYGSAYTTDDFFVLLDDSENLETASGMSALDMGVGRLPVKTPGEAYDVVNKIRVYASPASLGPWRLVNTYVADNEDNAGAHLAQSESMNLAVNNESPVFNSYKVYLDAMNFVSTPGGTFCPDANKAINDRIDKGTFLLNFMGHGNPKQLAHERIVTSTDYNSWNNLNKLPFMVTATCDFSKFDQPAYVSAGEAIILKPDGGAIAMLTTTHEVFAGSNEMLNRRFLEDFFHQKEDGGWSTFGEAFRISKNTAFIASPLNTKRFTLLGDPALQPAFPKYFVQTDSVVSLHSGTVQDTLRALGAYEVQGTVRDAAHNVLSDFNGRVSVTIYDKPRQMSVLTKVYGVLREYEVLDNVVYKGTATVTNGQFRYSFIAPKDINYDFGKARISYYAENGLTDAAGLDTNRTIGGVNEDAAPDNDAPLVQAFIGDTTFINGGITGANTLLYVKLSDESGINVTGSSVGHDLTAVLDGDVANPYILNDYYETLPNTYQEGVVRFPVNDLPDGKHRFTVKAWDVYNNSGEGSVDFEVVNGSVVAIQETSAYPNPFRDQTRFVFRHNHPDEVVQAEVLIYAPDGRLVRQLSANPRLGMAQSQELTWDGNGSHGEKLSSGVYLCRILITTNKGVQGGAYQKVVLLR